MPRLFSLAQLPSIDFLAQSSPFHVSPPSHPPPLVPGSQDVAPISRLHWQVAYSIVSSHSLRNRAWYYLLADSSTVNATGQWVMNIREFDALCGFAYCLSVAVANAIKGQKHLDSSNYLSTKWSMDILISCYFRPGRPVTIGDDTLESHIRRGLDTTHSTARQTVETITCDEVLEYLGVELFRFPSYPEVFSVSFSSNRTFSITVTACYRF